MARKQTRRSLGVSGKTYARIEAYCKREGRSIAGYIEELVGADLDAKGEARVEVSPYHYPKKREAGADAASGNWTF